MKTLFTKKHYEAIAIVLKQSIEHQLHGTKSCQITLYNIKTLLSDCFEEDNEKFDKQKFEDAIYKTIKEEEQEEILLEFAQEEAREQQEAIRDEDAIHYGSEV